MASYPTIQAYRDAANHRTSMKKTLRLISSELIKIAEGESFSGKDTMPLPLPDPTGPFIPSPMKEVSQEEYEAMVEEKTVNAIIDEATPDARGMPFAAGETGKSPNRQGRGVNLLDERLRRTRMDQFTHVCTEKLPAITLHITRNGKSTCTNNKPI